MWEWQDIIGFLFSFGLFLIPLLYKTEEEKKEKSKKNLKVAGVVLVVLFILAEGMTFWNNVQSKIDVEIEKRLERERFFRDSLEMREIIENQRASLKYLNILDTTSKRIKISVSEITELNHELINENRLLKEQLNLLKFPLPNILYADFGFTIDLRLQEDNLLIDGIRNEKNLKIRTALIKNWIESNYEWVSFKTMFVSDVFTKKYYKKYQFKKIGADPIAVEYENNDLISELNFHTDLSLIKGNNQPNQAYTYLNKDKIYVFISRLRLKLISNRYRISSLNELCNSVVRTNIKRPIKYGKRSRFFEIKKDPFSIHSIDGKSANLKLIEHDPMYPAENRYRLKEDCWSLFLFENE